MKNGGLQSLGTSLVAVWRAAVVAVPVWCKYTNEPYDIEIRQYYG